MSNPMFDSRVSILGLPAGAIIVAAGFVLSLVGFFWIRRIMQGEPEPDDSFFRALAERRFLPPISLILGVALLGFVALFAGSAWFRIGGLGDGAGISGTIQGWLPTAGLALEAVAVALTARRLWIRWRL